MEVSGIEILDVLTPFYGKSQDELKRLLCLESNAKNLNELILGGILASDGTITLEDIKAAHITPKTIRIRNNGKVKESMSFPTFRFTDIAVEEWEDSVIYKALSGRQYMFAIFEENREGNYVFTGVKFWSISENDLLEVKKVWENTQRVVREGVKLSFDGKVTKNNFPKASENPVSHIRPHAQDSNDTYPLPDGRKMPKQCFWLNNGYIEKVIKDIPVESSCTSSNMTAEEQDWLGKYLSDDIYFFEDIKEAFETTFRKRGSIDPIALKNAGYTCYSSFAIRDKYQTAAEYFTNRILERPTFDIHEIDERFFRKTSAPSVLEILKSRLDVIEYEDGKYITFTQLRKVFSWITKETLKDFAENAALCSTGSAFFNTHTLKNAGLESDIFDLGFSDVFYDSLLQYSGKTKSLRFGGGYIFYRSPFLLRNGDLIRTILSEEGERDIFSIRDIIFQRFGIQLNVQKLIGYVKSAGLFYDQVSEKVFLNKEEYYDEL